VACDEISQPEFLTQLALFLNEFLPVASFFLSFSDYCGIRRRARAGLKPKPPHGPYEVGPERVPDEFDSITPHATAKTIPQALAVIV
jgi:hypothetical protein